MSKKIEIEYDINKSMNEVSIEIVEIIKKLNLNIESLLIQLPIGISLLNESIIQQLGYIDIFTTNTMTDEDDNKIIIIINEKKNFRVAIDGPSGSGKSTIAKLLSNILGIDYLDTGAMYRAITYYFVSNNINIDKQVNLTAILDNINIEYYNENIVLNNKMLLGELRTSEVTDNVSKISSYGAVRDKLVHLQREIAKDNSIILDGRDIGSVVLPKAEYKFYIDAKPEVRARRRLLDKKSNLFLTYEEILEGIKERDHYDSTRVHSPLKIAEDAYYIDTSDLTIQEVIELILNKIRGI